MDVLLREKRDLEGAKVLFKQAVERGGVVPNEVITDKHQAYLQSVRQHAPNAKQRRTGLHRKRAPITKPVERSHSRVPVKDRIRSMRARLCQDRAAIAEGRLLA